MFAEWISYTENTQNALRRQILLKILTNNYIIMSEKRKYINPAVIEGTMRVLEAYKNEHTTTPTPMADYVNSQKINADERARFVRAAQRLRWNVVRSQGKIYENGVLVWSV